MKKIIFLTFAFSLLNNLNAQSIVGKWRTFDDKTGKEKSVVEIYKQNDKYYGKIVQILNVDENLICTECKDYRKNKNLVEMEIISGLVFNEKDKKFEKGKILDPENGEIYTCKLWVDEAGDLKVRGYIAVFYRTQTWKKEL